MRAVTVTLACACCCALASCDNPVAKIFDRPADEPPTPSREPQDFSVPPAPPSRINWDQFVVATSDGRHIVGREFPSFLPPWNARFTTQVSLSNATLGLSIKNGAVKSQPWSSSHVASFELARDNPSGWSLTPLKGVSIINNASTPLPLANVALIRAKDGAIQQKSYNSDFNVVSQVEQYQHVWDSYLPAPSRFPGDTRYRAMGETFSSRWPGWLPGFHGGQGSYTIREWCCVAGQPSALLDVSWHGPVPPLWAGLDSGSATFTAKGQITVSLPLGIVLKANLSGQLSAKGKQAQRPSIIQGDLTYAFSIVE